MSEVFTQRLGSLNWSDATDQLVVTVPAGQHWVIRDFIITNFGALESYSLYIQSGAGTLHLFRGPVPASGSSHTDLRQVALAGDQVHVFRFSVGSSSLVLTGYVFTDI